MGAAVQETGVRVSVESQRKREVTHQPNHLKRLTSGKAEMPL